MTYRVSSASDAPSLEKWLNELERAGDHIISVIPSGTEFVIMSRRSAKEGPNKVSLNLNADAFKAAEGFEGTPFKQLLENAPDNCRQKMRFTGKAYPKSGCSNCGSILRKGWLCPHGLSEPA